MLTPFHAQPKRKSAPKRQKKGILRGSTHKVDDAIRTHPRYLVSCVLADRADARAGVSDEDFSAWLNDCSGILFESGRPKIGEAQALGSVGSRMDAAMLTPSMILLEPFEGLGASSPF